MNRPMNQTKKQRYNYREDKDQMHKQMIKTKTMGNFPHSTLISSISQNVCMIIKFWFTKMKVRNQSGQQSTKYMISDYSPTQRVDNVNPLVHEKILCDQ